MQLLPVAACALATVALLVAERSESRLGIWLTKPVAAAAYVGSALAWGALETAYGRWLLLALIFCWWGDMLLIPRGRPRWFRAGILAFLAAHLVYIVAFAHRDPGVVGLAVGASMAAVLAGSMLWWLGPQLAAEFRRLVVVYIAVICVMLVAAFGAAQGAGPLQIALGATLFAVSDISVARDRFVSRSFLNRAWGLPLYFAAQLVLASTAAAR